jgi:exodeoxyribonuclease VII small subunit
MKEISFEKALEKLEKSVEELESGELSLDSALKKYEEGVRMAGLCREKLEKASKKVEVLVKKDGETFATRPLDGEEQ